MWLMAKVFALFFGFCHQKSGFPAGVMGMSASTKLMGCNHTTITNPIACYLWLDLCLCLGTGLISWYCWCACRLLITLLLFHCLPFLRHRDCWFDLCLDNWIDHCFEARWLSVSFSMRDSLTDAFRPSAVALFISVLYCGQAWNADLVNVQHQFAWGKWEYGKVMYVCTCSLWLASNSFWGDGCQWRPDACRDHDQGPTIKAGLKPKRGYQTTWLFSMFKLRECLKTCWICWNVCDDYSFFIGIGLLSNWIKI